jgi:hypothetical protein
VSTKCQHNSGWYVAEASIVCNDDRSALTIFPGKHGRGYRADKVRAVCNAGCGATRNVYLTSVEFYFGKVRKAEGREAKS